ncbi:MAG: polysaccharide deacetylase family protein [Dehalococcoidales bacterium]
MKSTSKTIATLKRYKLYTPARGAYTFFSSIGNGLFRGPVILVYHRVAKPDCDPFLLSVSPEHFREQMEYLTKNYRIVSLNELRQNIDNGKLNPKSLAVTFDDGYEDNFSNARPVLEQLNIPATIFVVSGRIGSNKEFWWDALERMLLTPDTLPDTLELTIQDKTYRWPTGGKSLNARWNVTQSPLNERHRLFMELQHLLRLMDDTGRQEVLSGIEHWVAAALPQSKPVASFMSPVELKLLAGSGLIDIGAHTVTHPVLSAQPPEAQRREIIESKRQLEDIVERPVTAFAYPYGSREDIGKETIDLVREAGFGLACANFPGYVNRHTDPLLLPRWVVRNWDAKEFAARFKSLRS